MLEFIAIPSASSGSGAVYYDIAVKLPLRSLVVKRRYSEFEELVNGICHELGIDVKEFPYPLPSKRINWFNNNTDSIVQERKVHLAKFLNSVIKDSSVQNLPLVHRFLQIPPNFEFSPSLFKSKQGGSTKEADLFIQSDAIDENNWLEIVRILKSEINDQNSAPSLAEKIKLREKFNKVYQPCLVNLVNSLNRLNISKHEHGRRQSQLSEVKNLLNGLIDSLEAVQREALVLGPPQARRVFGKPQETAETLGLNNKELLQQQVQVHQKQDQEIEQLRKIIQRQRQIGEAINQEVGEQNELLDQFNDEVDRTADKVKLARKKARSIV
ncbi:uncharacterized protein CANTADRAFT_26004 [Suhomyces tanzawaensis NRRL Y-17324]|uniref:Phox-like protein n=1 Tax=Suhomyces tanzawaensis NRRL Y-17324 TaxID=984487 RepID=A0A1E4SHA3_9ASCO|nr:uncharacterized protein CANTADRAFT_26004 [Suhomyces tanzawaensis NRRL Y-17324]ODV78867.1 hypothetical protein CANTADRAFT_26004 [Suhomyces tanzawaensis NRRL Y-17324]